MTNFLQLKPAQIETLWSPDPQADLMWVPGWVGGYIQMFHVNAVVLLRGSRSNGQHTPMRLWWWHRRISAGRSEYREFFKTSVRKPKSLLLDKVSNYLSLAGYRWENVFITQLHPTNDGIQQWISCQTLLHRVWYLKRINNKWNESKKWKIGMALSSYFLLNNTQW